MEDASSDNISLEEPTTSLQLTRERFTTINLKCGGSSLFATKSEGDIKATIANKTKTRRSSSNVSETSASRLAFEAYSVASAIIESVINQAETASGNKENNEGEKLKTFDNKQDMLNQLLKVHSEQPTAYHTTNINFRSSSPIAMDTKQIIKSAWDDNIERNVSQINCMGDNGSLCGTDIMYEDETLSSIGGETVQDSLNSVAYTCSTTSTSLTSIVCRICHNAENPEKLVAPCLCKGSLTYVHVYCLERWISTSRNTMCELCQFQYNTESTLRYTLLESLRIWYSRPLSRRALQEDCQMFSLLSLVAFGIVGTLLVGIQYYFVQDEFMGLARLWTRGWLMFFLFTTLTVYFFNIYMIIRSQLTPWYTWWQSSRDIKLILENRKPFSAAEAQRIENHNLKMATQAEQQSRLAQRRRIQQQLQQLQESQRQVQLRLQQEGPSPPGNSTQVQFTPESTNHSQMEALQPYFQYRFDDDISNDSERAQLYPNLATAPPLLPIDKNTSSIETKPEKISETSSGLDTVILMYT